MRLTVVASGRRWLAMIAAVAAGILIALSAGSQGPDRQTSSDPSFLAAGAEIYASNCQACHGAEGRGGTGPPLAGDLVARFPDVEAQRAVILLGPKSMPSFADRLTDDQLDAVIAFTRLGL